MAHSLLVGLVLVLCLQGAHSRWLKSNLYANSCPGEVNYYTYTVTDSCVPYDSGAQLPYIQVIPNDAQNYVSIGYYSDAACTVQLHLNLYLYGTCQSNSITHDSSEVSYTVVDNIDFASNYSSFLEQWGTATSCSTGNYGTFFHAKYSNSACVAYPMAGESISVSCYGSQVYAYTYTNSTTCTGPVQTVISSLSGCAKYTSNPYVVVQSCLPGFLTPTATPTPLSTTPPTTNPPTTPATNPPTTAPTTAPTSAPPTTSPTNAPPTPSTSPTSIPSVTPTNSPSSTPSTAPSSPPTTRPTFGPTSAPNSTATPTSVPTSSPSSAPSNTPEPSSAPINPSSSTTTTTETSSASVATLSVLLLSAVAALL